MIRRAVFQYIQYMKVDLQEWVGMAMDCLKASAKALAVARRTNVFGYDKKVEEQVRKRRKVYNPVTPNYARYWRVPPIPIEMYAGW